jgi:hypothetical protein
MCGCFDTAVLRAATPRDLPPKQMNQSQRPIEQAALSARLLAF